MKATRAKSLRSQVEKWLAPRFPTMVRVTVFSRTGSCNGRYVCVESLEAAGTRALFFFLHEGRCWSVLPPKAESPKMAADRFAT
ncbi:hypothetical protein SAMN04487926_11914 [Paraburkholderia steynii]|uniref:Uncharacterized protein n=1 Tax=Paraburkholderia steynii TaxID=1245441 RepID=A0A7Z7FJD3_9BURK|nr:hypothetical protein SAMN04487926_11914 [Paraburkholderia steynii]